MVKNLCLLLGFFLFFQSQAKASTLKYGVGLLSFKGAHYRGSDQSKDWFIPIPYFTYKSDKIEAEPSFIRGTFYKNSWMSIKLSIIAGLNVESDDNRARAGMPELDYTFEIGPIAIFNLWKSKDESQKLTFEFPFRAVNTTDLTFIDYVGLFGVPYLNFAQKPKKSLFNWGYEFSVAAMWGSSGFHDYFYGVAPEFATPTRTAYQGEAGFSGVQTTLVLNKKWGDLTFIPFLRWDSLNRVKFRDSPLFKRKNYMLGGLGVFWLFGERS